MFWELFSWKISFQLHEVMFWELISQSFLAGVYTSNIDTYARQKFGFGIFQITAVKNYVRLRLCMKYLHDVGQSF